MSISKQFFFRMAGPEIALSFLITEWEEAVWGDKRVLRGALPL